MKLIAYDINKLGNVDGFKKSENLLIIEEFMESSMDCAEIKEYTHKHATSCMSSLSSAIKRYKIGGVKAMVRKGKVFLVKIKKTK